MTAAAPAPVTRQPVPWDPWCWLQVQISTATGSTGDPDRVGYWQPATPDTADSRYTVWQATGVPIPPAGGTIPAGYGEWVQGNTGNKWFARWGEMSWRAVDCDLMSATFSTGSNPWDWNAGPGNGTLRLVDPDHTYFPSGPGSGYFDDIGVNTPIRVIANLTDKFDQNPANAARRRPYRVLITGLIRSIDHELSPDGTGTTVIHFSEPHVVYGRVNREAVHLAAALDVGFRMGQIHNLSDDPSSGLMKAPAPIGSGWWPNGPSGMQADDVAGDLWTEMCRAANSAAMSTALRLFTTGSVPEWASGNPQVHAFIPLYPPNPGNVNDGENYGLDTRILTPDCSPPESTFNYTFKFSTTAVPPLGDPTRAKIQMCPTGSIQFGHDDSQMANVVSIAAQNGTATVLSNQASIDRFYRHTFQRHDFVHEVADTPIHAQHIIDRLVQAVFHISDCDYDIRHPRDFEFAVGACPENQSWMDHPPVEPARWMKLDWGWITADLRVVRVAHQITPSGWTVTHAYEVFNPVSHAEEN